MFSYLSLFVLYYLFLYSYVFLLLILYSFIRLFIRVRGVPERLISSLRACAMGGHRVSVLVLVVVLVVLVVVVLAGGSRRVAKNYFVRRFLVAI